MSNTSGKVVGYRTPIHKLNNPKLGLEAVYTNGANNLYPYYVKRSIMGSPKAAMSHRMHTDYISGTLSIEDFIVDKNNDSNLSDLILRASEDVSIFQSYFIHISYKLDGEGGFKKDKFTILPYENCRVSKLDDDGRWSFVFVDDFHKDLDKKKKPERYYRYNDSNESILEQVKKDATEQGLDVEGDNWLINAMKAYRGQVRYLKMGSEFPYTTSQHDSVLPDCNTDFFVSKYDYEMSSGGFFRQNSSL